MPKAAALLPRFLLPTHTPGRCRLYLKLQHLYRERADQDVTAVQAHLASILKGLGKEGSSIGRDAVRHFCKNARSLRVTRCVSARALELRGGCGTRNKPQQRLCALWLPGCVYVPVCVCACMYLGYVCVRVCQTDTCT